MRNLYKTIFLLFFVVLFTPAWSQDETTQEDHSYKPLTVKLSEDGKKYVRFILWHQMWMQTNNLNQDGGQTTFDPLFRRSRVLAYAQVSPRFMLLTHFGLNNLTLGNQTALGNDGDGPQMFLHDAWGELRLSGNHYVGGGLHYWKGLTRLSSASTLNFMTLDQPRPFVHWHSLGITDQFARHLGIYAKGEFGKFDYRIAMNGPGNASLGDGRNFGDVGSALTYRGSVTPKRDGNVTGRKLYEGYFRYNFWDKESTKLPYNVGSYLGSKKVLAIGAGFFAHPNGMVDTSGNHSNVSHFAVDAYLDQPIGANGDCLNAYASFINFNYGENYMSRWAGTGTNIYAHVGYLIGKAKLMPYFAVQSGNYEGLNDNLLGYDVGVNYFVNGHFCKITAEYHNIQNFAPEGGGDLGQFRLQLHVFL